MLENLKELNYEICYNPPSTLYNEAYFYFRIENDAKEYNSLWNYLIYNSKEACLKACKEKMLLMKKNRK